MGLKYIFSSFLTKDSHDVWSKLLLIFILTVLLKKTVCDYLQLVGWDLNGMEFYRSSRTIVDGLRRFIIRV